MRIIFLTIASIAITVSAYAQNTNKTVKSFDEVLPVRGFSISVPAPENVDEIVRFINQELGPVYNQLSAIRRDALFESGRSLQ